MGETPRRRRLSEACNEQRLGETLLRQSCQEPFARVLIANRCGAFPRWQDHATWAQERTLPIHKNPWLPNIDLADKAIGHVELMTCLRHWDWPTVLLLSRDRAGLQPDDGDRPTALESVQGSAGPFLVGR